VFTVVKISGVANWLCNHIDWEAVTSVPETYSMGFRVEVSQVYEWHVIQGDSGGICNTLGNDSMCDSKQKKFI